MRNITLGSLASSAMLLLGCDLSDAEALALSDSLNAASSTLYAPALKIDPYAYQRPRASQRSSKSCDVELIHLPGCTR